MKSFATFLAALPAVLAVSINRRQTAETIPGSWIAQLNENSELASALSIIKTLTGLSTKHEYSFGSFKGFSFDGDDSMLDLLETIGVIKSIEPDTMMYATVPVGMGDVSINERALTTQTGAPYGLGRISHRAKGSTSYIYDTSAGSGTYIYVIDTGINTQHVEFTGRARNGVSYISGATTDDHGHGTHCSGTAASRAYGVAKSANLIGVKVLAADGTGPNSGVIAGINWAVNDAVNNGRASKSVISMSLGGGKNQQTNDAVANAVKKGIFVAVAAGNDGVNAANTSPASEPSVCTVGATDSNDAKPAFSNFGSILDIFAPGVNILSAWIGSTTATNTISGTSMATPHIAGLAAYLIALEGSRSPSALCQRIQSLSTKNVITSAGSGSPNYLAYNGNGA